MGKRTGRKKKKKSKKEKIKERIGRVWTRLLDFSYHGNISILGHLLSFIAIAIFSILPG